MTVLDDTQQTLATLSGDRIYHAYPTFGREHATASRGECWCQPYIEIAHDDAGEPCGAVIVHNVEH